MLYHSIKQILTILFIVFVSACSEPDEKTLAVVNSSPILSNEIDTALGRSLRQLEQQVYKLKRQKLDELIDEKLLGQEASRRGTSLSDLLAQEVDSKISVTDDEILALYNANKSRIPVDLDKVRDQIRDVLQEQKRTTQKTKFVQSLRTTAKIETYLTAPPIFRAKVSVNRGPAKGSERAPVTIVKFEDFQCPYCKTVQATYQELLKRYNGKLRLVHKDLPLDTIHPQARQAAEAARCAGEQGKFWNYHDLLYANSTKLSLEDLKGYAGELGLNEDSFRNCYNSGKFKSVVQGDFTEGSQLGITGTPTFFINGRELSGAQPVEAFAAIIDQELSQAK